MNSRHVSPFGGTAWRKALILGAAALCVAMPATASARTTPPAFHRVNLPASQWLRLVHLASGSKRTHMLTGLPALKDSGAPAPDVSSASALQIPWSTWPSGTKQVSSGALTAAKLDDPNSNFFSYGNTHQAAYSRHGAKGGYQQQATIQFGSNSEDTIQAYWTGSYFDTAANAAIMANDAVSTMHRQGFSEQPCYLADESSCHLFVFPIAFNSVGSGVFVDVVYAVWNDGNALGELAMLGEDLIMQRDPNTIGGDFKTLVAQGDAVVAAATGATSGPAGSQPAPADPSIGIDGVDLMHYAKGKLTNTSILKVRETGFFVAPFHVSAIGTYTQDGKLTLYNARGRVQIVEHFVQTGTTRKPDKVLFDSPATFDVTATGNNTPFLQVIGTFDDPSDTGSLTATFTGTLGSSSTTHSLDFTLKSAKVHCPQGYHAKFGTCFKKK